MLYIIALVGVIIAAGMSFILAKVSSKFLSGSQSHAKEEKIQTIDTLTSELSSLGKYMEGYASPAQLESAQTQLTEVMEAFEAQRKKLAETEAALSNAQKAVETKETQQQEQKTMKDDDEKKLTDMLSQYEMLSEESVSLEQELANAMKNLEEVLASATLTDIERDLLTQFNDAVIAASGRLRDLMTEYGVVRERLETIQGQFKDLEEEYTRLVEQQLGV